MAIMTKRIKQCHDTTLTPPKDRREENISRFEESLKLHL